MDCQPLSLTQSEAYSVSHRSLLDRLVSLSEGVFWPMITTTGVRYGTKHTDRQRYSTEDKIGIVLAGLRGEDSIAARPCDLIFGLSPCMANIL